MKTMLSPIVSLPLLLVAIWEAVLGASVLIAYVQWVRARGKKTPEARTRTKANQPLELLVGLEFAQR